MADEAVLCGQMRLTSAGCILERALVLCRWEDMGLFCRLMLGVLLKCLIYVIYIYIFSVLLPRNVFACFKKKLYWIRPVEDHQTVRMPIFWCNSNFWKCHRDSASLAVLNSTFVNASYNPVEKRVGRYCCVK